MSQNDELFGWNEIEFLSWAEFQQMAPSIIQLEITRLGKLIAAFTDDTVFHNALVKCRYEMKQFIGCLEGASKSSVSLDCAQHLQVAILALSLDLAEYDQPIKETVAYVLDRLNYVNNRISLIY